MFNLTASHALKALAILAKAPQGVRLRATDVAREAGTPVPYTTQILTHLSKSGVLHTKKGPGGGTWIADPNTSIRNVLEQLQVIAWEDLDLGDGFNDYYRAAYEAHIVAMGKLTIADLAKANALV